VAFPNGTGSAAGKQADRTPRATVSPLSNANTSDNQSPPARGHGKEVGEAGEGLQDDSYQMLRDGFSKHGEDALVLQMLLHDRVIGGMDEAAVGDGEGEMEGPVRPGGGSFGMKPGDRGAFVEIGLPFDGTPFFGAAVCPQAACGSPCMVLCVLAELGAHRASALVPTLQPAGPTRYGPPRFVKPHNRGAAPRAPSCEPTQRMGAGGVAKPDSALRAAPPAHTPRARAHTQTCRAGTLSQSDAGVVLQVEGRVYRPACVARHTDGSSSP